MNMKYCFSIVLNILFISMLSSSLASDQGDMDYYYDRQVLCGKYILSDNFYFLTEQFGEPRYHEINDLSKFKHSGLDTVEKGLTVIENSVTCPMIIQVEESSEEDEIKEPSMPYTSRKLSEDVRGQMQKLIDLGFSNNEVGTIMGYVDSTVAYNTEDKPRSRNITDYHVIEMYNLSQLKMTVQQISRQLKQPEIRVKYYLTYIHLVYEPHELRTDGQQPNVRGIRTKILEYVQNLPFEQKKYWLE